MERALRDLLDQVDSLDDITLTRDVEQYKAESNWNDALSSARDALSLPSDTQELGPCSCQDSGKCKYIDGSPACMQEPAEAAPYSLDAALECLRSIAQTGDAGKANLFFQGIPYPEPPHRQDRASSCVVSALEAEVLKHVREKIASDGDVGCEAALVGIIDKLSAVPAGKEPKS